MNAVPQPLVEDLALWNALPGMAMRVSADGELLQANSAFAERMPDAAESLGTRWLDALTPPSRRDLLTALARRDDFALRVETIPEFDTRSLGLTARWLAPLGHCLCLLHDVTELREAEQAARTRAELLRLLADNVPALLAYYESDTMRCVYANSRYAETFGMDGRSIVGRTFGEVIGDEAERRIRPQVDRVLQQRLPAAYERELATPDGTRYIEVNLLPHLEEAGRAIGCFVLISDISKHRLAEIALRESEERLAKFMQASAEGIVFHKDGFVTDANPPALALIGYTLPEILGCKTLDFIAPDHVAKVASVIASGQETAYESVLMDKHGQRIPVEFIVRTMVRNGERMRMTIVRDLRDRHAAQARIHHLAHHDTLTGLPNRSAFMEHLDHLMAGARDGSSQLALLFIDLDHFKRVNDSLGHLVGDTLLRTVAARITASLRATDIVARFGGDEFMVLLPSISQRADVDEVAQKLLQAIEAPVHAEGRPLSVTASAGVALFPQDGPSAQTLIKHADTAMYLAKARGRAQYRFFDPAMASSAYAALVMEGELAHALERGEFELHFQPQVSARDGSIVGAEALIRWHHPTRGLLPPGEFIPVAEQQRLMLPIGQWVLREAARCAGRWHAMGLAVAPVAVNLSTMQFQSASFSDAVAQVLREEGVDGHLIEVELTERMLMDDLAEVGGKLEKLAELGIRVSVDDFGTGYSSLGHLKELPIDKMKIDRSFVKDLPGNRGSTAITRAIIQMARSLGITAIAEGVETEAQRSFLALNGCDELQGDLISKPLPAAEFEAWVRTRRSLRIP
ncbi:EAL domain-containing protein [Piscinibacter sp.]|uniref:EAL domain-containing protein n=1 Tax=Piscinibacter sp. TaxID=1903157 RepID=UPI002CB893FB|nr:EAL domain-containing protein [Albitalea sp.]HUG25021.1 EAL domain-containing protein [Albitalea sp.]